MKARAQTDPELLLRGEFFRRDPVTCARGLIGCEILWEGCGGIIVETEAYSVRDDEACHTFSRPSSRAFVAAHPPGTAYVYLRISKAADLPWRFVFLGSDCLSSPL
ncbi:MAG: hypothetical protein D4R65_04495 [Verrucomicrobiaceae bacterium]|nr:MAG: hypothetical protein D4R65_04495 [Verrucomicrobiaceae bacterium]